MHEYHEHGQELAAEPTNPPPGTEPHDAPETPASTAEPTPRRRFAVPGGRLETRVGLAAALSFLVVLGVAFSKKGWLFGRRAEVGTSYAEGEEPDFHLADAAPPPPRGEIAKPRPVAAAPPIKLASHDPDELPPVPAAAKAEPPASSQERTEMPLAALDEPSTKPPAEPPTAAESMPTAARDEPIAEPAAKVEPVAEVVPASPPAAPVAEPLAEPAPAVAAVPPAERSFAPTPEPAPAAAEPTPAVAANPPPPAGPMVPIPNAGRRNLVLSNPVKPAEPAPAPAPRPGRTHVVAKGETFYTISKALYGSGRYYRALHAANRAEVPQIEKLYVGTALRVPMVEDLDPELIPADDAPAAGPVVAARPRPRRPSPRPEPVEDPKQVRATYVVRERDTPRTIARDTLGDAHREDEIIKLNLDRLGDDNRFAAGTKLVLPEGAKLRR